jgi:DNA polymerase elongation subunit (family B)
MQGWILDLYPGNPGEMVVWLKLDDGTATRLVDHWSPSIFIGADSIADLDVPLKIVAQDIAWTKVVRKFERVTDRARSEVVEAKIKDARKAQQVAGRIERLGPYGAHRLYNADVPPAQSYLYEHDLFPLARCEVKPNCQQLQWNLDDDVWAYDYAVPNLRQVEVDVDIRKEGKIARFTDRIMAITIENGGGEKLTIDAGSEADKLLGLVKALHDADPDFVLTNDGDTFLLPYLVKRAEASGVAGRLVLDRDGTILKIPSKGGTSYFSYGRIHYKPSAMKLYGRLHIDVNTSFAYSEAGFEGLFELSRICRMPMQTASRASIGKALSSLQFYHASKMDLLVPWKPTLVEHFKDRNELLMADRGGFIFEPKMGVHEGVAELDFNALYPNIMYRKNISAETVKCSCCPDSNNRVPELGWNICQKRIGIVPTAMKIIVEKRLKYKELKKNAKGTDYDKYNERQAVLKWIGVCSFGYLGFSNAKFGRIDAHIAVCAWDRHILLDAARVAERRGFEVIHGIVDSLWVKKFRASPEDYLALKSEIESETSFTMSFEGIYKWVTFLPSKVDAGIPVLNRYFGAYQDGELKVRGVEARRHDTPLAFARCQMQILRTLAKADTVGEARARVPECVRIFLRHAEALERHEVPASELAFTTNLSKAPDEYTTMTIQHMAINQLVGEGVQLHAGEGIRYVITDYDGKDSRRATPVDVIRDQSKYDAKRYVELLAETCASVLEPFDPQRTAEGLLSLYENHKSTPLA